MRPLRPIGLFALGAMLAGCWTEPLLVLDLRSTGAPEVKPQDLPSIRLCKARCSEVCSGTCPTPAGSDTCTKGPKLGLSATVAIYRPDQAPFDIELHDLPCEAKLGQHLVSDLLLSIDPAQVAKRLTIEIDCDKSELHVSNCCGSACGCEVRDDGC